MRTNYTTDTTAGLSRGWRLEVGVCVCLHFSVHVTSVMDLPSVIR